MCLGRIALGVSLSMGSRITKPSAVCWMAYVPQGVEFPRALRGFATISFSLAQAFMPGFSMPPLRRCPPALAGAASRDRSALLGRLRQML